MSKLHPKKNFRLSVLTPFYNEINAIDLYFSKVVPQIEKITPNWEIICIDDGSKDYTKKKLIEFCKSDERIKLISFSRNFGKEAALTAAIDHASGDAIIPIDADLQDPPSVITKMVAKWQEGYKIVNAVRKTRSDGIFKKIPAQIYHKLLSFLTNGKIIANVGDFRLIDRKALNAITCLKEKTRYMKGVISWVGFKSINIEYHRPQREIGETKLGFLRLLKHGYDGIFSFSSKPLKVWLYLGLMISFVSFIYACYLITHTLVYGIDLPGYASIMVAILFMGGIQLISLGIIGEYVARIFKEVKNRPIYLIDETYGITNEVKKKR